MILIMGEGLTEINYCLTWEWCLSDVVTADTWMTPLGSSSHFYISQKLLKIGLVKNFGVRNGKDKYGGQTMLR